MSAAAAAPDEIVVVGVIDTTNNYIEHPQTVAERIIRVARALGDLTRVMAGTDCGFETSSDYSLVAAPVVWAKLAALSAGARLASKVLFEAGVPRPIAAEQSDPVLIQALQEEAAAGTGERATKASRL